MQVVVEQKVLLRALSRVQGIVERKGTIPILQNVLLTAEKGEGLRLVATDLDIEVRDVAEAQVLKSGRTTVPASTLYELVRKAPPGAQIQLSLSDEDPRMLVTAGRFRSHLPVLPAIDFPELPDIAWSASFEILGTVLAGLINKTRFAISTEETRYYLSGLYLHTVSEDGQTKLRAVATDGHRLALAHLTAPDGASAMPAVIVPRKTINEVLKPLDGAATKTIISVSEHKIRFELQGEAGALVFTSKVIDGSFPDYERVIPKGNDKLVAVDTELFAAAVDRVAVISTEKARSVKLAIEPGKMTLRVRSADAGASVEELELDYDGAPVEFGLNARYAIDVAAQITGEQIHLAIQVPDSPVLVTDPKDASALYVVMPMRV